MISSDEIKKIAKLAKLSLNENDIGKYTSQLSNIMQMISEMNKVDTDSISPMTSVCDMETRLRDDEVTEQNLSDSLFSNAPGKDANFAKEIKCFIVPKVVE